MDQLPSFHNWLRFVAEKRYVAKRLEGLQRREAAVEKRKGAAARRRAAREARVERWQDVEAAKFDQRGAARRARLPDLQSRLDKARARAALQRSVTQLLLLPTDDEWRGSSERTRVEYARTIESAEFDD
eukprot:630494-Pleurochrysis_carterae.AAC.1